MYCSSIFLLSQAHTSIHMFRMNQLNDQDSMTRWARCLLSNRINLYLYSYCIKFVSKRLEEKLEQWGSPGYTQMCTRSRTTLLVLWLEERKRYISSNVAFLFFCTRPWKLGRCIEIKIVNMRNEHMSMIKDWFLFSYRLLRFSFSVFFFLIIDSKSNGVKFEVESTRSGQKVRSIFSFFFCFIFFWYSQVKCVWTLVVVSIASQNSIRYLFNFCFAFHFD